MDPSKYAIDLDIYQVAYLHRLLPGNQFRFQPEETAKRKIQSVKKGLIRKRNAKSNNTDSVISNSDKFSSSERNVPDSSSIQSKVVPSTPSKAKDNSELADQLGEGYSKTPQAQPKVQNESTKTSEAMPAGKEILK